MKEKNKNNKIYDVIIIWAGAAGLFSAINIPTNFSKLLLEKNKNPWIKILLSGWERANISNMDIEGERDYFGQNKKSLKSIFTRYNQWDIMNWFAENWINIIEEDRWRLILESWNSRELLNILVKKAKENNSKIITEQDVKIVRKIKKSPQPPLEGAKNIFEVKTEAWEKYLAKNVIISSWWKSFFQVWTTGEWYNFAETFWINIIEPHRSLCWLTTKQDFKGLSWSSLNCNVELLDNNKSIYSEFWPLLFTHFWVSWPIIFNTGNALWEYLNSILLTEGFSPLNEQEKIKYILQNMFLKITISEENSTKKITKYFKENNVGLPLVGNLENTLEIISGLQDWRSWKEAKATGWWIDLDELDKFMQTKKVDNLFFIWEVCDITWKTWGFNLQWAWSSAFCCTEYFKK